VEIVSLAYPLPMERVTAAAKAAAIGHFDGVHRGHRTVIERALAHARAEGMPAAVMTFDPHPKEVLGRGSQYVALLTPLEEKLRLFEALGVDIVYVVRFDEAFAAVPPEEFASKFLAPLGVATAVVGFDFTFGHRGAGDAAALRRLGAPLGMEVDIVEPFYEDGRKVSSSLIRESLERGEAEAAAALLGRPYRIAGTVVHGEQRGRTIGFPTANVEPDGRYVLPRLGVYAVKVEIDGRLYPGVLNLGVKPTFHEEGMSPKLEAHLFDFAGDLYGKRAAVGFLKFLRAERKFASVDELVRQIAGDAAEARAFLKD